MTPLCPRSNDPPMFVSDLIHAATRPWNMEVVREHMYEMDAEAVANKVIGKNGRGFFVSHSY
jgi:hypothetical protein